VQAGNFTAPTNWSLTNPSRVTAGCCGQAVTNSRQMRQRGGPWSTVLTIDRSNFVVFAGQTRGVWPMAVTRVAATVAAIMDANQYHLRNIIIRAGILNRLRFTV
jgi:hypothetical protein